MKDIFSIDYREAVRRVVRRIIKDEFGVKIPKEKLARSHVNVSCEQEEYKENNKVFGISLDDVPSINVGDEHYLPIPRFIVAATTFLKPHLKTEGLFRKSGSLGRQRAIRKHIEDGFCNFSEMSHPHDIASLLKQFFRELPDSLLSSTLHSCFVKSLQLNTLNEQTTAILLLCLLLPDTHLRLLQYFSRFITQVSNHSEESGMTPSNLAIVLSPNLMFTGKEKDCDKFVKEQTQVVEILFRNSHQIGMVNDEILEKVNTESDANAMSTSSGDELESSLEGRKRRVRRRRSRSISGFVSGLGRKIKGNPGSGLCIAKSDDELGVRHHRCRSEKMVDIDMLLGTRATSVFDIISQEDNEDLGIYRTVSNQDVCNARLRKRKPNSSRKADACPERKSPRLSKRVDTCQSITNPRLVTMPTQLMLTPKKSLKPVRAPQTDSKYQSRSEWSLEDTHSPFVDSERFKLDLEDILRSPSNKASMKKSKKYAVIRGKPVQRYTIPRTASNSSDSSLKTSLSREAFPLSPAIMQKEFNTPTDKKRFEESQEDVNCCSSCPPTPKLDDRSVNNWQRLVTIEAVRESPMK